MAKGPGKSHRKGISLMQIADMFATEEKATKWFEDWTWPTGEMACTRCGSLNCYRVKSGKPMPYRCRDCRKYFSLKTGTLMEDSKLPLRVWGWAIYREMTSLKGVSSMKLHRDLGISQPAAWFLLHRIRGAFADMRVTFSGPDEAYFGGKRKNMSNAKRAELKGQGLGRGPKGKQAVVAAKDRKTGKVAARVIERTDGATLGGLVDEHASPDAKAVHGRRHRLPGHPARARNREALRAKVRPLLGERDGPHQRRGELFGPCSRGRTRACITVSPRSTCKPTWIRSRRVRISATWIRSHGSSTSLPG